MIGPPVLFSPEMERGETDEAESGAGIDAALRDILEITSKDYGHAVRSVHAKSHGLLEGELIVPEGLSPTLAQGLFAVPGTHKVVIRFSTNPGDVLDDSISVPRGVAIKVLDVAGDRLPGSEDDTTQDFVFVNGPAFFAPDAKHFLTNLKLLAKTTDRAEGGKKLLSAVLQAANAALSAVGLEVGAVQALGGAPNTHPLGEIYYSQTAFLYGDHIAKFSLAPVSPNLTELTGMHVNTHGRPDALREDISETMIEADAVWELRVQLARDIAKQPIEDPSIRWNEQDTPFETVATIRAPHQISWSPDRAHAVDDAMAFSVWHGLAAHRPLGSINRVRRAAYQMSSDFRARYNGCPIHEPKMLDPLPV